MGKCIRNLLLIMMLLLYTTGLVADNYRILSVNGSSVQINGVPAKVGDVFDDKASINWGKGEKLVMRVYDVARRKLLVMSSANGSQTGNVREFLSDNRHLSTKDILNDENKQAVERVMEYSRLMQFVLDEENKVEGAEFMDNFCDKGLNSEDQRIELSQAVLTEVFASPKAVVKTVGSNGQTVVATETAEDFLLRLATLKTDKRLMEVASKKDGSGKLTELTVRME